MSNHLNEEAQSRMNVLQQYKSGWVQRRYMKDKSGWRKIAQSRMNVLQLARTKRMSLIGEGIESLVTKTLHTHATSF